jgi:hypothetical protein
MAVRHARVAQDLLLAAHSSETDDSESGCWNDIQLVGGTGDPTRQQPPVPANRFVLAARSPVFRKMLYGKFAEAQSSTIYLPEMESETLRVIVHFCLHHELAGVVDPPSSSSLLLQSLVRTSKAAQYLELPVLQELAEDRILRMMVREPGLACFVYEWSHEDSRCSKMALAMIEQRPYVTLSFQDDDPAVGILSTTKLRRILSTPNIAAGEWFLLQVLQHWHQYQLQQQPQNGTNTISREHDEHEEEMITTCSLLEITREICDTCIRLEEIEPTHLLQPQLQKSCPFIPPERILMAVAQQALVASMQQSWKLSCSRGSGGMDRCLVENSGDVHANGFYYRIHTLSARKSSHNTTTALYSKREIATGQARVYHLSRCLVKRPTTTQPVERNDTTTKTAENNNDDANVNETNDYYEYRIFASPFLTTGAVRQFHEMNLQNTIDPFFQPVVQFIDITAPSSSSSTTCSIPPISEMTKYGAVDLSTSTNTTWSSNASFSMDENSWETTVIPTPIRKYYRIRLSDGEHFVPGTLSRELNTLVKNGLQENHVIRILEFGLYTLHDQTTAVHIMKASVVSTLPLFRFGNPVAISNADANGTTNVTPKQQEPPEGNHRHDKSTVESGAPDGVQNLYRCRQFVNHSDNHHHSGLERIPSTGWILEEGASPAPTCTWIPAAGGSTTATDSNTNSSPMSASKSVISKARSVGGASSNRSIQSRRTVASSFL